MEDHWIVFMVGILKLECLGYMHFLRLEGFMMTT